MHSPSRRTRSRRRHANRGNAPLRQSPQRLKRRVTSAVEGARKGGVEVARVEVDWDDKIVIFAGKPELMDGSNRNPWDEVLSDDDVTH